MVFNILLALGITLAVETPIFMLLRKDNLRLFLSISGFNIFSNVLMNCLLSIIKTPVFWLVFLVMYEILTFLMEAAFVCVVNKTKVYNTLWISFVANASSLCVGLLITTAFKEYIIVKSIILGVCYLIYFIFYIWILLKNLKREERQV